MIVCQQNGDVGAICKVNYINDRVSKRNKRPSLFSFLKLVQILNDYSSQTNCPGSFILLLTVYKNNLEFQDVHAIGSSLFVVAGKGNSGSLKNGDKGRLE